MRSIDLNCDVGESSDPHRLEVEARVMQYVTSANIACGFHAGSQDLMRRTVNVARSHGIAVGAHPGFHDAEGAGRRPQTLSAREVENLMVYQIGALSAIAALEGIRLSHVKPHGALYAMAALDGVLATAIASAVAKVDRRLILYGLAGSRLTAAGRAQGLTVAEEAFADRAYRSDGSLVPRDCAGALIEDEGEVAKRVVRIVRENSAPSVDGPAVPLRADSIGIHGDTDGADRLAAAMRMALEQAGVQIKAVVHAGA